MVDPTAPIAPHTRTTRVTEVFLKEKKMSLTGDSATVKDKEGNLLFKFDAKTLSLSERRIIMDASGSVIGQLRRKRTPGIHKAVYLGTESDDKKVTVVKKGLIDPTHDDANIKIGDDIVGEAKGDWRSKKIDISIGGRPAAHVHRKTNAAGIFLDADTYCITVQPGYDLVFITMVTIALDELYHDDD